MWSQSDENSVTSKGDYLGIINPGPTMIGVDGERLTPQRNE
jgi:hypothetical protein